MELWFTERYGDVAGLSMRVEKHLYHEVTPYQRIDVFETPGFGRVLTLDGLVMVTEKDEFVYHEALVHPAMVRAESVERVMIVGGGDGGSLREVLKYEDVKKVDVVEIDPSVIEVSRRFFPDLAASFDDERVTVIPRDVVEFVADCPGSYDVLILDTSDPVGPAKSLYSRDFYGSLKRCLRNGGVITIQSESPWWQQDVIGDLAVVLKEVFGRVHFYYAPVLSYPGGMWLFSLIGEYDPRRQLPENLRFVDDFFAGNLWIPPFVRELVG